MDAYSDSKDICSKFFKETSTKGYFTCVLCEQRCEGVLKSYHCASGYTNLMNHLKSNEHKDEWKANYDSMLKDESTKSTLDRYRMEGASADARKYHGWIDWIVSKNLPFDCVDDFHYQKYSNLGTVSSKTIKKYMKAIQQIVKTKISENLPSRFGLIFDGWSNGTSEHVVALFATCATTNGGYRILLAVRELDDTTNQNADNHIDFIDKVLLSYGKNHQCIDFIVGDNTNLNPKIARQMKIPFIGCYSHKLNLAVKGYQDQISEIIRKVEEVMIQLRTNNNYGLFKSTCDAKSIVIRRPTLRNVTRWSSTYLMLKQYVDIHQILYSNEEFNSLNFNLLSGIELQLLKLYLPVLEQLNDITKALQQDSLTLSEARVYFDVIVDNYSDLCPHFLKYLKSYNTSPFETGVIKVYKGEQLNIAEITSLRNFRINIHIPSADGQSNLEENVGVSLLEQATRKLKRQKVSIDVENTADKYSPMYHISPTSNVCERLFSQASLVYNDRRKSMKMETFEMILFLKANDRYWNVNTLDEIIKSKKIVGDQSYLDDDYETTEYIPIPIAEEGEDYQTDQPIVDLLFDNK